MAIPKIIYQTFKTDKLPFLFRWHIKQLRKKNPAYTYEFFDDVRMDTFILEECGPKVFELYKCINIGAAKADFFRYAVLYKKGGVYLDVDSRILFPIDSFVSPQAAAVIAPETQEELFFIQYGLFFEAGHPFLRKTLEMIIDNLLNNRYPNDTHKMTGPTVYSQAIRACLKESPSISYDLMGVNYDEKLEFSFFMSKTFLYKMSFKNKHWKKISAVVSVLDEEKLKSCSREISLD
ncbi:MAG: glycosyltransferase family 32 protein [Mangrovibacterium sp.]